VSSPAITGEDSVAIAAQSGVPPRRRPPIGGSLLLEARVLSVRVSRWAAFPMSSHVAGAECTRTRWVLGEPPSKNTSSLGCRCDCLTLRTISR
jgi:hypothetical protein